MKNNELNYYNKIKDWDFSMIKCEEENLTNWNMYEILKKYNRGILLRRRYYGIIAEKVIF